MTRDFTTVPASSTATIFSVTRGSLPPGCRRARAGDTWKKSCFTRAASMRDYRTGRASPITPTAPRFTAADSRRESSRGAARSTAKTGRFAIRVPFRRESTTATAPSTSPTASIWTPNFRTACRRALSAGFATDICTTRASGTPTRRRASGRSTTRPGSRFIRGSFPAARWTVTGWCRCPRTTCAPLWRRPNRKASRAEARDS